MKTPHGNKKVKKTVREGYAKIAKSQCSCCSPTAPAPKGTCYTETVSPSLGCGNPIAMASLKAEETVVDLGSGFGFDCFLAASKVGENGRVIGVDMTLEMVAKAGETARKNGYKNVEFILGDIEKLPIAQNIADIVISNCVINLSPDKEKVFKEAFRVLKPGGRLMISDIVLLKELPEAVKNSEELYVACVSGAVKREEYLKLIEEAGFTEVKVVQEQRFPLECLTNNPMVEGAVLSITVYGKKPQ
ncbi:MAG: arsenite methyltransferase [Candidatus Bathyarchaeia archaeon]